MSSQPVKNSSRPPPLKIIRHSQNQLTPEELARKIIPLIDKTLSPFIRALENMTAPSYHSPLIK